MTRPAPLRNGLMFPEEMFRDFSVSSLGEIIAELKAIAA
jgi:hypothetical protein